MTKMKYDYRLNQAGKRRFKYPIIYKITYIIQCCLHKLCIAIHNPFSDECTSDFNCCENIGKRAFIKIKI